MNSCEVGTGAICARRSVSNWQRQRERDFYLLPGCLHGDGIDVKYCDSVVNELPSTRNFSSSQLCNQPRMSRLRILVQ